VSTATEVESVRPGALALALLALVSGAARAQDAAPPPRPNVLFLVVDDLNDWVGCLGGNPQTRTPNIDRLASRGMLFTNAHAAAPSCNPSRVAVLTGVAPYRSGLYDNTPGLREVFPDAVTLPQRLHAAGYHALGSGKVFHHAYPDPASWDEFFPSKDVQMPSDTTRGKLVKLYGSLFGVAVDAPATELCDGKVAEWVSAQLARPPQEPFFLACGFYRPHTPWVATADAYARFPLEQVELPAARPDDLDDVPAAARTLEGRAAAKAATPDEARRAVQAYLACIAFVDDQVGRVLDALDRSPAAKNTIVVLWGDNGFHLGQKERWGKETLWEESTHVPLIVLAPGVAPGSRCARPVSLQDLHPTLLELCGLPPVAGVDGTSLTPLLADPEVPWERPALTTSGFGNHSVRSERWRYTRYADGGEELYDLEADPHEWTNRAADPACAATKAELARWIPTENAADVRK